MRKATCPNCGLTESYFQDCPRDESGRCLPGSGGGGAVKRGLKKAGAAALGAGVGIGSALLTHKALNKAFPGRATQATRARAKDLSRPAPERGRPRKNPAAGGGIPKTTGVRRAATIGGGRRSSIARRRPGMTIQQSRMFPGAAIVRQRSAFTPEQIATARRERTRR